MQSLHLSGSPSADNSDPSESYQRLRKIIDYQFDRYTGMHTFTLPLLVHPLNHQLYPFCKLIIFLNEDRSWSSLLTLHFQMKGAIRFPPPGEPVNWLIGNQRISSCLIDSNGQTVSTNFRVGTDVMPGPLTLWVSAPVTMSRTAGWVSIWMPEAMLESLAGSESADFRFAGLEFRLTGDNHASKKPHPLGIYVSAFRGFIEQRPDTSAVRPLLEILEKLEQNKRKENRVYLSVALAVLGFAVILFYWGIQQAAKPSTPALNSLPVISPSPTVTPTKRRRK